MVKDEEKKDNTLSIQSLVAKSANTLEATFASAVDTADTTISVTKSGSTTKITGTVTWNETYTVATFTAAANFTAGTYEMTAVSTKDAANTSTAKVTVENEKVAEIVIKGDTALTSANKKEAYVYYDVLNQYGESIRTATSITWTISSGNNPKVDKATGKITATKGDKTEFTYGSFLYVTGVYNKTGVTVQKQLTIGMEQSLDSVKTAGFVKMTDKNKIINSLPTNFQKGQYVMVYQVFDQNENLMDVSNVTVGSTVTFISDNVLLMTNDFNAGNPSTLTIDGEEYATVTVTPGQYVDKGGEVNITAISNKTGKKTVMNYVIGAGTILKSVVLSQPASVVADGESAEIPYVAYDTEGNAITNYESIARTTNSLNLTAAEGTLELSENNDGTAKFTWKDKSVAWTDGSTKDEIDRSIALATVVVGGESNNMILSVSDKARPVAVKSVTLKDGGTTAIVANDTDNVAISDFTFVDQYGRTMSGDNDFFAVAAKDGWNNEFYAVKAAFNKNNSNFSVAVGCTDGEVLVGGAGSTINNAVGDFTWTSGDVTEVKNETVKYSVVSNKDKAADVASFDNVGKTLNVSYSVVPMKDVSSISINKPKKQYINIGLGEKKTGAEANFSATDLADNLTTASLTPNVDADHEQTLGLSGSYNGTKVVIPSDYVAFSAEKFDVAKTNGKINTAAVSANAIKLGDFFNAEASNFVRKDGSDTITAKVYTVTSGAVDFGTKAVQHAAPTTVLSFSDAMPAPAEVKLCGESCVVNATDTDIANIVLTNFGAVHKADGTVDTKKHVAPWANDQYGVKINCDWTYNISDITENDGAFAHLDKSFVVNANDTDATTISYAELGDKYTLTLTAYNQYGSAKGSVKITVGSDTKAVISTDTAIGDSDKTFRKGTLDYAY